MSSFNTTRDSPLGPASMYSNYSLLDQTLHFIFNSPNGREGRDFSFTEDLRKEIEENEDKSFISFGINNTNYQHPVGISNSNLYHNVIEYLENTYGYKTGRYMEIYHALGDKYEKDSPLCKDFLRSCPNIAFLHVNYIDSFRYQFFYEKNKRFYSVDDFLSIPLYIFGRPYKAESEQKLSKSKQD